MRLLLGLHADDLELDLLALFDEVLGASDVAQLMSLIWRRPAKPPQVDEGAEGGEALDLALDGVSNLGLLKEVLAALLDVLFHPLTAVEDDIDLLLGVEPLEIELRGEADELIALLDALNIRLGRGKESPPAHGRG